MYISYIFTIALLLTPVVNVLASGLGASDIDTNPEGVCMMRIDQPEWKDLCDWINICDDTGEVNSTDEFCTGEAVSNPPGPGGCPEGFHSVDDDESGLCYTNAKGCEYEGYIFRPDNKTCGEIVDVCREYPEVKDCRVTIDLSTPRNSEYGCETSVPDFCVKQFKPSEYAYNGTWIQGTDLDCRDVNMTDFRVTLDDRERHHFDYDFDGIGCENKE